MSTYFLMWNIIGSVIFIVLILLHITLKNAEEEERKREELEKRRKAKFEERYLREKKEIQELQSALSINESRVVRELMLNYGPHNRRLVYENYMLGIYMFEIYDYNTRETFYVIYDRNYSYYYYNWGAYTDTDNIIKIVEYHRNLKK